MTARGVCLSSVLLVVLLVPIAQAQPAFTVTSTQRVRLTEPAEFWRAGTLTSARDLIVIRANVRRRGEFMLRDTAEPFFILGSTIGLLVQNPVETGQAIVVAPRTSATQTFWLTGRGLLPQKLVPPLIDRLRQQAATLQRSVPLSPGTGPIANFQNLEQLVRSLTAVIP